MFSKHAKLPTAELLLTSYGFNDATDKKPAFNHSDFRNIGKVSASMISKSLVEIARKRGQKIVESSLAPTKTKVGKRYIKSSSTRSYELRLYLDSFLLPIFSWMCRAKGKQIPQDSGVPFDLKTYGRLERSVTKACEVLQPHLQTPWVIQDSLKYWFGLLLCRVSSDKEEPPKPKTLLQPLTGILLRLYKRISITHSHTACEIAVSLMNAKKGWPELPSVCSMKSLDGHRRNMVRPVVECLDSTMVKCLEESVRMLPSLSPPTKFIPSSSASYETSRSVGGSGLLVEPFRYLGFTSRAPLRILLDRRAEINVSSNFLPSSGDPSFAYDLDWSRLKSIRDSEGKRLYTPDDASDETHMDILPYWVRPSLFTDPFERIVYNNPYDLGDFDHQDYERRYFELSDLPDRLILGESSLRFPIWNLLNAFNSWRSQSFNSAVKWCLRFAVVSDCINLGRHPAMFQRVQIIPEPSKFRIITAGPGSIYNALQPLQGQMLDSWARDISSTMRLLVPDIEEWVNRTRQLVPKGWRLYSVDYKDATDLLPLLVTQETFAIWADKEPFLNTPEIALASFQGSEISYPGDQSGFRASNLQFMDGFFDAPCYEFVLFHHRRAHEAYFRLNRENYLKWCGPTGNYIVDLSVPPKEKEKMTSAQADIHFSHFRGDPLIDEDNTSSQLDDAIDRKTSIYYKKSYCQLSDYLEDESSGSVVTSDLCDFGGKARKERGGEEVPFWIEARASRFRDVSRLREKVNQLGSSARDFHVCVYRKSEKIEQTSGQLMGHPLSFALLCAINRAVYLRFIQEVIANLSIMDWVGPPQWVPQKYSKNWDGWSCPETWAGRLKEPSKIKTYNRLYKKFKDLVLTNGDDQLFWGPPTVRGRDGREVYLEFAAQVGFKPSVGKNYVSERYALINNKSFWLSGSGQGSRFSRVGFLNPKVVAGISLKNGDSAASMDQVAETINEMFSTAHWTAGSMHRIMERFGRFKSANKFHLNFFLPTHLGGIGIRTFGDFKITSNQRRLASYCLSRLDTGKGVFKKSLVRRKCPTFWTEFCPKPKRVCLPVDLQNVLPPPPEDFGLEQRVQLITRCVDLGLQSNPCVDLEDQLLDIPSLKILKRFRSLSDDKLLRNWFYYELMPPRITPPPLNELRASMRNYAFIYNHTESNLPLDLSLPIIKNFMKAEKKLLIESGFSIKDQEDRKSYRSISSRIRYSDDQVVPPLVCYEPAEDPTNIICMQDLIAAEFPVAW